jgi:hypothetical protein
MRTRSFLEAKGMRTQQDDDGIPWTYHSERETVNGPG